MPQKRGRPISDSTDDPVVAHRRQLAAARVGNHRERQRAARSATAQPTQAQLQQGERIVELGFTDLDAAETLAQLGFRTRGLTLAQGLNDAQLQREAVAVDEHNALYGNQNFAGARNPPPPPPPPTHRTPGQSQLTQFFTSRPPGTPFSAARRPIAPPPTYRSPVAPSFSSISSPPTVSTQGYQGTKDTILINDPPNHDSENEVSLEIQGSDLEENHPHQDTDNEGSIEIPQSDHDDDHTEASDNETFGETFEDNRNHGADGPGIASNDSPSQHTNNGEEDSVYNFASERSVHFSDEDSEAPIPPLEHTVDKLFEFFSGNVGGCTEEQHSEQRRQHIATVADDDHHGLNDVFNDPNVISVLASPDLLTSERLARHVPPSALQWQSLFCGVSPQQPHPQHVCLHQEETQAEPPQQAYDVDSFLGSLYSLGACRKGLWHQPAPQARQNMTNDMHLKTSVFTHGDDPEQVPRSTSAMLRDVPHFLRGRVAGAHDITLHVLFPHLPCAQEKFVSLTREQLTCWLDRIFHPAIYSHCDAHYTQHLTASFWQRVTDISSAKKLTVWDLQSLEKNSRVKGNFTFYRRDGSAAL